jgi:hypothetical protein
MTEEELETAANEEHFNPCAEPYLDRSRHQPAQGKRGTKNESISDGIQTESKCTRGAGGIEAS